MKTWKKFSHRQKKIVSAQDACQIFFLKHGGKERQHLNALWKSWDAVLGVELAQLGFPLGHSNGVLLVGSEDNMALQELSMQAEEILERVNTFMDKSFFTGVKLVLLQGNRPLNLFRPRRSVQPVKIPVENLPDIGSLLGKLDPASPVTLCYEAYVELVKQLREEENTQL